MLGARRILTYAKTASSIFLIEISNAARLKESATAQAAYLMNKEYH